MFVQVRNRSGPETRRLRWLSQGLGPTPVPSYDLRRFGLDFITKIVALLSPVSTL